MTFARAVLFPEDCFRSYSSKEEGAEANLDAFSIHLKNMVESAS